jgi:hypothetical protein
MNYSFFSLKLIMIEIEPILVNNFDINNVSVSSIKRVKTGGTGRIIKYNNIPLYIQFNSYFECIDNNRMRIFLTEEQANIFYSIETMYKEDNILQSIIETVSINDDEIDDEKIRYIILNILENDKIEEEGDGIFIVLIKGIWYLEEHTGISICLEQMKTDNYSLEISILSDEDNELSVLPEDI